MSLLNNRVRQYLLFAYQGIKDRNVASIVPTFPKNVEMICREIPKDTPVTILEYGPGTGAFTQYLLRSLHSDSVIVVIEQNAKFVNFLRQLKGASESKNPTLHIVHGDAAQAPQYLLKLGIENIDYCFSGIPISFLSEEVKRKIIQQTFDLLIRGGAFFVYQVSPHAKRYLKDVFPNVSMKNYWVNIPPLFVFEARR